MIATALLLSLGFGFKQDPWKPVTNAWITGFERSIGGEKRNFAIEKAKGVTSFAFVRPLQNALGNVERVEQFSGTGIETWLVDRPNWSLRLYEPSRPDLTTWMLSPRFTAKDLVTNTDVVSRTIGQATQYLGIEKSASRDCYAIQIASKPIEKMLVDKETGLTLRFEQRDPTGVYYERQIEAVELGKDRDPMGDPKRKIVKGIPNAAILTKVDWHGKRSDYEASLADAKKALKSFEPTWVRTLPEIGGYEFKQTIVDSKPGRKLDGVWPANRLGGPELEPGGLPPGWSIEGTVTNDDTIFYSMTSPEGAGPRVLTTLPKQGGGGSAPAFSISIVKDREVTTFSFVSYISSDGRLVIAPGTSVDEAQERRRARSEQISGAGATVWTDFMSPTGDTISFLQLRNRSWKSLIRVPALPAASTLDIKGTSAEAYTMKELTILSWKQGGTDYVLASSAVDLAELTRIAKEL